jgi:hypothetical protein
MFMAPFVLVAGPSGAFLVLPLFGMLLVLGTYAVGARFGARIGVAAAVLVAASPVFLYQLVQPMSDVPAAALWALAVATATGSRPGHVAWSGVATSAAILVRPNLLPLGLVIGLYLLLRPDRSWRQRLSAAATYAAASAVGCVGVALVQYSFFGSPFASGYGDLGVLFSAEHVVPNLRRYAGWLVGSQTIAPALALLAPFVLPGALTALLLALVAINLALYLPYVPFEDWSFLRFLLPALPFLIVLTVAAADAICRRWLRLRDTRPLLAVAAAAVVALSLREAVDRNVFRLRGLEARFERAGSVVGERLPANAVVLSAWHSGSVRFYGDRLSVVWTEIDPAWLDAALAFFRERGYTPYLLLERWEEPLYRQRFSGMPLGRLDWPPMLEIATQVRIYRPEDRELYRDGRNAPTEYVR